MKFSAVPFWEMSQKCMVILLLGVGLAAAKPAPPAHVQIHKSVASAKTHIVPELEPVSDAKFMKKDYPDDRRPKVYHKFGYPFPTVQDSEDYDKDYPEDKNDDGGYWDAQMAYDKTKRVYAKELSELQKAQQKKEEEKKELDAAKEAEKKAEERAEKAEKEEKEADAHHDDATKVLKDAKQAVNASTDEVMDEITDLEECKKQLKEARAELKKALEEKEAAEKEKAAEHANETAKEKDEVAAEKTEAELEKQVTAEQAEYEEALKALEQAKANSKGMEDELAKAAANLRKFRHADPDGGVYEVPKKQPGLLGGSPVEACWSSAVLLVALLMQQLI